MSTSQAFKLTESQAAISVHTKPDEGRAPSVQILTISGGLVICGVESLQALRVAIDFALEGAAQ